MHVSLSVQLDLIVINYHNELYPIVNMERTVLIAIVTRARKRERERERERKRGNEGACEQL